MNQHHASSSGNNNAPTPMELGAVNQHKQLPQADKDFRKAKGLCLYCGSKDHILRNCNRKKPLINNGIALTMEGEIPIDLAAKVATSKFQSIIVIPITAYHGPNEEEASDTDALIDTGAIHNFVSFEWADYLGIPIEKFDLDQRRTYRLADGTEYVCKAFCAITIRIDDTHHVENTTFHVLESCSFHVILGMQWLKRHRPHL
ncbi:hypothetical protein HMPREF1544_04308 [Mucor circinelloides 1006PhL]|uniref:CCHC-type domain-containing protein n=1 Tax=Mucor circinelloides f. circinelloides (strain 1006PhL) TaxID=1220926 RepID=S2K175_MUCC1|nr:hypothetical protein HMPREF1544_04308 [Mucor circinelloides 1006PhL]